MSQTDLDSAAVFFAEFLLPLQNVNARRNVHYFARDRDASQSSYWEDVATRTGGMERISLADGEVDLLDRLGDYWRARSDNLERLLPALRELRAALIEAQPELAADEKLTEYVYPLF